MSDAPPPLDPVPANSATVPAGLSPSLTGLPPAIVLVRPQLAENIGAVARAMLNFGLTDLRLVRPRDGWPNPDAGPAASGADVVLANATLHNSLASAVADCTQVYATTVRRRGVTKPVFGPGQAMADIRTHDGRSAILFGPERSGLESDDVALARHILTIPVNPDFSSLNLAQAVVLVAYEWSRDPSGGDTTTPSGQKALVQPTVRDALAVATQGELEGLIGQMDTALADAGFYFPPERTPTTRRTLRSLLTRPGWSAQEVRTLRGMIAALINPRPKGSAVDKGH